MNKALLFLCFLLGMAEAAQAQTQVSSIRYSLKYNTALCGYDVYMHLETGNILPGKYQQVSTNQVTIVVPTGATVGNPINNEPRGGSQSTNTSTCVTTVTRNATPKIWSNTNTTINDPALPGKDIYAFVVPASNAYWPTASQGDSIRMFTVPISSSSCGSGIRLWNNNVIKNVPVLGGDPSSVLLSGQDYNNGMNMFNSTGICATGISYASTQTYNGNRTSYTTMPAPVISSFVLNRTTSSISGSITATSNPAGITCASSTLTYSTTGPLTFATTSPTFTISPTTVGNYGTYTTTVTNSLGCTASASQSVGFPLPVKLISFKGASNRCAAQINWEIGAGEKDFQRFELQYSSNADRYATVGMIDRNPYNNSYSFSYTQASGKGYYRLKIIDLAGKASYSQTLDVTTDCDAPQITIAPNPTAALATVSGIEAGDQVKVTDMLGNVIANYVSGGSKATIDLEVFASGVYNVIISRNHEVIKAEKITKL